MVDEWYTKLQASTTLPFGGGGVDYQDSKAESLLYTLELGRLEFKQLTDGDYWLNLMFFDFHTRRFGGSQWTQHCMARNSKIQLDQNLLFRSLTNKNGIVVVVELGDRNKTALCWTAIPVGGVAEQIEMSPSSAAESSPSVREQLRRSLPLFAGSCRVLLLASTGFRQLEPQLRRLDAVLSMSLRLCQQRHHHQQSPLIAGHHHQHQLLPDFYFLPAAAAAVPSQQQQQRLFTALLDNVRLSYANGGLRAGDAFLLDLLAREFCYAMNRKWKPGESAAANSGLRVLERRLKMGAHNGLAWLDDPVCVLLEPLTGADGSVNHPTAASIRQRSRSLGRVEEYGMDFGVRQSIRFRSLPVANDTAIVFQLEYLVACPLGDGQDLLTNARLVRIAWNAWTPCTKTMLDRSQDDQQLLTSSQTDTITLQLLGGPRPGPSPPFGLCLRDLSVLPTTGSGQWPPMPPSRVRMDLHFNFVPLPESEEGVLLKGPSQLSITQQQQPTPLPRPDRVPLAEQRRLQQQRSPSSTAPPLPPPAPLTVETERRGRQPFLPQRRREQLTDEEYGEEDEGGEGMLLWPMDQMGTEMSLLQQQQQQQSAVAAIGSSSLLAIRQQPMVNGVVGAGAGAIRVELPLGRVYPLPRLLIPQLAKFPAITASSSNLPVQPLAVDVQNATGRKMDLEAEASDQRWPGSELSIQFLAFLAPAPGGGFPRAQQPARLFFSFQLYHFRTTVTECLFAESPEEGQQHSGARGPMLLWREGGQQPGLTLHFAVPPEQQRQLADYLFSHQLHVHVWEADSLFHLGIASIPLKLLLRQGSPAVQCSVQCPVFQAGFPPAWSPSSQGQGTSSTSTTLLNGLLFMRLANVGLPSASTAAGKLPFQIGGANRKRVQSLHASQQSPLERFMALQRLDLAQRSARLFGPEEQRRMQEWAQLKKTATTAAAGANVIPRLDAAQEKQKSPGEKFLFAEELAAYRALRREGKALALLKAVFSSITTSVQVNLTVGQLHFFTLPLHNPLAQECVCELDSNDPRLSPITSPDELRQFNRQRGALRPEEGALHWQQPDVANKNIDHQHLPTLQWRLGLRAMEQLEVPMRFDPGLLEEESTMDMEAMGMESIGTPSTECRAFVRFLPSGQPLAVLELRARVERPALSQDLRWFAQECRKLVRVVPLAGTAPQSLRCSDPTVLCQLQEGGRLLRVECQLGEAPALRCFHLFFYDSKLGSGLKAVWRISIHSLGHLHSETVQGQPVRIPLALPSNLPSSAPVDGELIRLFCSPQLDSLRFQPAPAFPAAAALNIQPALLLSPGQLGRFHLLVNAVRASAQQPVAQWLCTLAVGQPNVTKVFQVIVPSQVQTSVRKRIPLDNPLAVPRHFLLTSSDPTMLTVASPSPIQILPNSSVPIQLDIHPPNTRPAQCQALLFVQDAQTGSQEEAFQLNIRFH